LIIANHALKKKADPPAADTPVSDSPSAEAQIKNVITTTQWLSVISILVSMVGLQYKREEIKKVFCPKKPAKDTT